MKCSEGSDLNTDLVLLTNLFPRFYKTADILIQFFSANRV